VPPGSCTAWRAARSFSYLVGIAWICLAGGTVAAATWTAGGLSFSDEPGGARLLAASGTGARDDPIVLVEEIIGPGPAVLEIRNGRTGHLDVSPATGFLALSVVKIVVNRGPWRWAGFDLELMSAPGRPSVYSDGLSFDQPRTLQRIARADRFLQTVQEDEPFDRIRFDGGQVGPAEYLRLDFDIVDANGTAVFYLVQRPIILLAWNLAPSSERNFADVVEPRREMSRNKLEAAARQADSFRVQPWHRQAAAARSPRRYVDARTENCLGNAPNLPLSREAVRLDGNGPTASRGKSWQPASPFTTATWPAAPRSSRAPLERGSMRCPGSASRSRRNRGRRSWSRAIRSIITTGSSAAPCACIDRSPTAAAR
jgi:hypothetical protein